MSKLYHYKKSIDNKIICAVEQVLRSKVLKAKKIKGGEINHVYKIQTDKNTVVARVFGYPDKPADGMLLWIEKQLGALNIPYAKLLYYSRDKKYFPNGFMISEFVDGLSGWDAIESGAHTLAQSYEQSGKTLRKIHNIKLSKYGPINSGKGKYKDFIGMELRQVKEKMADLVHQKALSADVVDKTIAAIKTHLELYKNTFHPVLLHGDASRENSILTKDKTFILIDWDNAWSGIWMWDYIEASWWWLHLPKWKDESIRKTARKAFFKGYGKVVYTPKEIDTIERGLHLIKSVEKMHYYYFDRKEIKNFNLVKKVFLKLLLKKN